MNSSVDNYQQFNFDEELTRKNNWIAGRKCETHPFQVKQIVGRLESISARRGDSTKSCDLVHMRNYISTEHVKIEEDLQRNIYLSKHTYASPTINNNIEMPTITKERTFANVNDWNMPTGITFNESTRRI